MKKKKKSSIKNILHINSVISGPLYIAKNYYKPILDLLKGVWYEHNLPNQTVLLGTCYRPLLIAPAAASGQSRQTRSRFAHYL